MSVQALDILRRAPGRERPILDHVSVEIEDGAFIALVGPSGAGKTSLLRVIAGLDSHEGGQVLIDGVRMDNRPARDRHVGFVFQNYALFRHMTVAANIAFGLKVLPRGKRPSKAVIADKVRELLDLMHLPDLADAYPQRLSGGQRQRVALARALATGPGLLLLDEPFGALDPMIRKSIRTWLRELHDQLGLTTILVTHDHQEAVDVADRLVVMRDGQIVQTGSAEHLDRHPASPFIMDFMGDLLRFGGVVRDGRFIPDEADLMPLPLDAPDGRAEALIRPHEILPRPGLGRIMLTPRHTRGGLATLSAHVGDRVIEIVVPAGSEPETPVHAALDLTQARIFRGEERLGSQVVALDDLRNHRSNGTISS